MLEDLFIIAASLVLILLVLLTIFGLWLMQKRAMTLKDLLCGARRKDYSNHQTRKKSMRGSLVPDWKTTSGESWDSASVATHSTKETVKETTITIPAPTAWKRDDISINSRTSNTSYNSRNLSIPEPSTPTKPPTSFLEDATPPRPSMLSSHSYHTHTRDTSVAPSLYSLAEHHPPNPQQEPRLSKMFPAPPETPAPSFQQFMANRDRRHTATKSGIPSGVGVGGGGRLSAASAASQSRVSTASRDPAGRDSTASLAPRFRTVDSWVGQQSRGFDPQTLQEHVTELPTHTASRQHSSSQFGQAREKHYTQHSDATVFRVHPGTEVAIPRGSLVPSEILDRGVVESAL